ncbi:VOC family protein [Oceanicella actignis]|uniref:Catechol 2,3-dioxygenase n=1 Tax=Oceanicella actignis TaxID=1189325 RepID=A0A1M7SQC7_9RHOB|nr:VOC family protein [Oceanicella actignis]TYO90827.1 catechol 2,3-dioxygenase-like lactoylglutathione lyase family enzyme [Oceanicella actignis]SES66475.1 Catechol 2,3-dioxygenase [Oceanicella actignis]SHN60578.1 Catechol 2,3-dioxygenase [Oceanicella actignis]
MSRPPRILETCLYCDDLDAAEAFYGGVVGLERIARVEGRHVFFRADGGMLLIFDPAQTARPAASADAPPPHGAHGPGHVCFSAAPDGIEAWERRLARAGAAIEARISWPGGARSIYARDPAGNSVEFAEPALWPL